VGQGWVRVAELLRFHRDDPAATEAPYRKAARIFAEGLGPEHEWTASARRALGEVLTRLGRFDEAEGELLEAERILVAARGEDHGAVARARRSLAELYEAWGRGEEGRARQVPVEGSA
jgi:hypothetical protein